MYMDLWTGAHISPLCICFVKYVQNSQKKKRNFKYALTQMNVQNEI